MTPDLSLVIPVYRGENILDELVNSLAESLQGLGLAHEIILVDDGSPDGSWPAIQKAAFRCASVTGVRLSRNFGQHYAISAGLQKARGKWVVVMDCDLQDQPSEIPKLLQKAKEGYDVVLARRADRKDPWRQRLGSRLFYGLLAWLTGSRQDSAVGNFGVYSDRVIAAINSMPEAIRYFPTMVRWVGFRTTCVDVVHAARTSGKSSYGFRKKLNLAVDICLAFSDKPLRLVVAFGFMVSSIGFLFAAFTVVKALRGEIQVLGYASLIVSIWVLAGLIMLIVGVVGLYVGKSFEGIKRRPSFIIAEKIN